MIEEFIKVRINHTNIEHYSKYKPNYGDIIIVSSFDMNYIDYEKIIKENEKKL